MDKKPLILDFSEEILFVPEGSIELPQTGRTTKGTWDEVDSAGYDSEST